MFKVKGKIFALCLFSMLILPVALSTISEVQAVRVGEYFTCKFVDSTGRWEKKTSEFEPTDVAAYVWSEVSDMEIGTTYDFIWYWREPSLNVHTQSTYTGYVATGNADHFWAWLPILGRAPEKLLGEWSCEMYYRWRGGNWLFGFKVLFTIGKAAPPTPSTYPVTIVSNVKDVSVTVDGVPSGGGVFNWEKDSTHSLMVEKTVSGEEGVRYVFESWSDGNTAASRTITITGSMTYTANYKTQYYLTIKSDHGNVEGEDWYDEGSKAYAILGRDKIEADVLQEYVFKGWSGDASGNGLKSNAISMDGPKEAIATWEKQFSMTFYGIVAVIVVVVFVVAAVSLRMRKRAKKEVEGLPPPTTCPKCGASIGPENRFCPTCGQPLFQGPAEPPSPASPGSTATAGSVA